jgi:hypothetical protein
MNFRTSALALAVSCIAAAAHASSPSNDFILLGQSGKPVGKASYSIDKAKNGFKVHARYSYHLNTDNMALPGTDPTQAGGGAARTIETQYTFEYAVDANGDFTSGYTRDSSTQTMISFQPDKARTNINISALQAGVQQGSRTLALPRPDFLVAPDFDPSALQALLTSAAAPPPPPTPTPTTPTSSSSPPAPTAASSPPTTPTTSSSSPHPTHPRAPSTASPSPSSTTPSSTTSARATSTPTPTATSWKPSSHPSTPPTSATNSLSRNSPRSTKSAHEQAEPNRKSPCSRARSRLTPHPAAINLITMKPTFTAAFCCMCCCMPRCCAGVCLL